MIADENVLKIELPDVKGWERSEKQDLPRESGGGFSVAYDSNGTTHIAVTVYVYNRGLARISSDLSDARAA